MFVQVLVLSFVFGLVSKSHAEATGLFVDLGYSKYNGFVGQGGINQWWGIRYAAPPVGELRFRAPEDPVPNTALQQANTVNSLPSFNLFLVLRF